MKNALDQPSRWNRVLDAFAGLDGPLLLAVALLAAAGLVVMYSAGFDHGTRFVDHGRNMLIGLAILFAVAQVPPQRLMTLAVPIYPELTEAMQAEVVGAAADFYATIGAAR